MIFLALDVKPIPCILEKPISKIIRSPHVKFNIGIALKVITKKVSMPFWMKNSTSHCFKAFLCLETTCATNFDWLAKYLQSLKMTGL